MFFWIYLWILLSSIYMDNSYTANGLIVHSAMELFLFLVAWIFPLMLTLLWLSNVKYKNYISTFFIILSWVILAFLAKGNLFFNKIEVGLISWIWGMLFLICFYLIWLYYATWGKTLTLLFIVPWIFFLLIISGLAEIIMTYLNM